MAHEEATIAVVGGGPAGLAAAEILARHGHAVTIYDRMPSLGRKFLLAGRGGLNLTHSEPLDAFLARYHPAEPMLSEAVSAFPPEALRAWCDGLDQPTFVGSSGRVFPQSFKASPLLRAWLARLTERGVAVRTRHRLIGMDRAMLEFVTPEGRAVISPRASLLALGGASWPRLGSDGAWTPLLEAAGASLAPMKPANVGFTVAWSEHFASRFAGTPIKRTGFDCGDARIVGEAVVAQDGLEGGAIYALSRMMRDRIAVEGAAVLTLDLRPDLDPAGLEARLARRRKGESLSTHLRKAAGLAPVAVGLLREAHGIGLSDDPQVLSGLIKSVPLRLLATRPIERAISTAGGVRFAALDERFMLRAKPGTFLAGEMLDWEAPTGGYLLQAVIASGRAAAQGMITWLAETSARDAATAAIRKVPERR